jgi:hypothetical protein
MCWCSTQLRRGRLNATLSGRRHESNENNENNTTDNNSTADVSGTVEADLVEHLILQLVHLLSNEDYADTAIPHDDNHNNNNNNNNADAAEAGAARGDRTAEWLRRRASGNT